jgi:hypothetical protein
LRTTSGTSCTCCMLPPLVSVLVPMPPRLTPPDVADMLQTLVDKEQRRYEVSSEMSIEFEVDGPYKVGCALSVVCDGKVAVLRASAPQASAVTNGWKDSRCRACHALHFPRP